MENETNAAPQTPEPAHTPKLHEPKSTIKTWSAVALAILILVGAAYGAFWLRERTPMPTQQNLPPSPTPAPTPVSDPTPEPSPTEPELNTYLPKVPAKPPAVEGKVDGTITWHYPTDAGPADIVNTNGGDQVNTDVTVDLFDVGTFNTGKYQGKHIFNGIYSCSCMGGGSNELTLIGSAGGSPKPYTVLSRYSAPIDNFGADLDKSKFSIDTTTVIPDLELPDEISGPGANQNLVVVHQGYPVLFDSDQLKLVFTDPKLGSVYTNPDADFSSGFGRYMSNGFYVKAPDWTVRTYIMLPNFVSDNDIAQITWSGGEKNTKQYVYTDRMGCGGSNYASVVSSIDVNIQNDLVVTGMTVQGEVVYGFKDPNHKIQKNVYDTQYYTYDGSAKLPYAQFVAKRPVFLWVDPFNRLIKFVNNDFVPQAECGKPVIYLYPTQDQNVSVKVEPTGGFSYTEPDYGSGWNVFAKPNGQLTNLADNKTYPYLFWEGRSSGIYEIPDKGFVVAKSDVHNFLNEKLAALGLNAQETADFEEYWEPYMQSAPYYFVTFMGNSVMDQIAPLSIDPKPDTVIRILMDFKPLQQPIEVQGFNINTPVRSGFTVVEWGGVKH